MLPTRIYACWKSGTKRSQINMSELQRLGVYFVSASEPVQLHEGSLLSGQSGPMSIAQHAAIR